MIQFDTPSPQPIIDWIKSIFVNTNKKTAVIGLSGGIDSAVSLSLAAAAIGPDNVVAIHMPAKNSNPIHLIHAQAVALAAGLSQNNFQIIPIKGMMQKCWRNLNVNKNTSSLLKLNTQKFRLANLAARLRMVTLYDQAKKLDALVIGTENYSEHLLGYFTRFGDEASDLEPIRHLFKTQVFTLAKTLNIPNEIITKPPTADLWMGQTDANELGFTYEDADPILMLIAQGISLENIINLGHDPKLVAAVTNQVNLVKFKHQVPYLL